MKRFKVGGQSDRQAGRNEAKKEAGKLGKKVGRQAGRKEGRKKRRKEGRKEGRKPLYLHPFSVSLITHHSTLNSFMPITLGKGSKDSFTIRG